MRSRSLLLSLAIALLAVILVAGAESASARGPISYNNPYRSFNLSGVNYGSMQWERQHHTRGAISHWSRGGGLLGRRR